MLTAAALLTAILAVVVLWQQGRREERATMEHRAHLLDEAAALFPHARRSLGPDGFPVIAVSRPDGAELVLGLLVDTLVTRRLPQLWLKLTLREAAPVRDFSLGALARPAGSEFYAMTHDLPDWIAPPTSGDVALLLRGKNVPAPSQLGADLATLFADAKLKEAVVTPLGVRIIHQACQGDRGSHLLLRQARFAIETVPAEVILSAVHDAERLSASMRHVSSPAFSEAA